MFIVFFRSLSRPFSILYAFSQIHLLLLCLCLHFFLTIDQNKKACSTQYSQAATYPITNLARCCLTIIIVMLLFLRRTKLHAVSTALKQFNTRISLYLKSFSDKILYKWVILYNFKLSEYHDQNNKGFQKQQNIQQRSKI